MNEFKVFGTGLQRTGTMSLTRLLNDVGIASLQFPVDLYRDIRCALARRYRGFTDFPVPLIYRQLDRTYPNSKFIHMYRTEEDWLRSVRWLFTTGAVKFRWERNPAVAEFHRSFFGRTTFDAPTFVRRYRAYNGEVRK